MFLCLGVDRTQTGYYFAGATALMHDETIAHAQAEATEIEAAVRLQLQRSDISWAVDAMVRANPPLLPGWWPGAARFADLVILPKPYGEGQYARTRPWWSRRRCSGQCPGHRAGRGQAGAAQAQARGRRMERVGRGDGLDPPCPADPAGRRRGEHLHLSPPPPERHSSESSDPGAELSRMPEPPWRQRRGLDPCADAAARFSEVIARHVADIDADLLVMGAYGHSRFREAILGGATRNMLEHAKGARFHWRIDAAAGQIPKRQTPRMSRGVSLIGRRRTVSSGMPPSRIVARFVHQQIEIGDDDCGACPPAGSRHRASAPTSGG